MGACLDSLFSNKPMKFNQVNKTQTSKYSKLTDEDYKKHINLQYLIKSDYISHFNKNVEKIIIKNEQQ